MSVTQNRSSLGGEGRHIPEALKIVDLSHLAEQEARFRAQKEMHVPVEDVSNLSRWQRMKKSVREAPKKVWKELTKHYRKNKALREIRSQIEGTEDIYAGKYSNDDTTKVQSDHVVQATLDRFDRNYDEEDVLREGEEIRHFDGGNIEEDMDIEALKDGVYKLISEFTQSDMDDATFLQKRREMYNEFFHGGRNVPVSLYADNALELAHAVRNELVHLDKIQEMDLTIGKAQSQFRTEQNDYSLTDRAVDYLQTNRVTDKIPPGLVSMGVALAIGSTKLATKISTSSAVRAVTAGLGGGAVVGATKYLTESKALKDERVHVAQSEARGEVASVEAHRRKELSAFNIEMRSARELIQEYSERFVKNGELRDDLPPEELKEAISELGEIEGRIRYADLYDVDTIKYDVGNAATLHTELMIFRAKMKVGLRKTYNISRKELQKNLDDQYLELLTSMDTDKDTKNEAFKDFRRKKALRAGLKGGATGFMLGVGAQEVTAFFNDSVDGIVESGAKGFFGGSSDIADGAKADTSLKALVDWASGDSGAGDAAAAAEISMLATHHTSVIDMDQGGSLSIDLPEGYNMRQDDFGNGFLETPEGKNIEVEIDPDTGTFDQATRTRFHEEGILMMNEVHGVQDVQEVETTRTTISGAEYLQQEGIPDLHVREEKPFWFGNNSNKADFNEKRGYWAGENGSGLTEDGDVQFRIRMQEYKENADGEQIRGSKVGRHIGKPGRAIREGRMFYEVTPAKDGPVFRFPFHKNPDGSVTMEVSKDHPGFNFCFKIDENGELKRVGYLYEVVEEPSEPGGRPAIYASNRGPGLELPNVEIEEQVTNEYSVHDNSVSLSAFVEEDPLVPVPSDREIVPVIPILRTSRRELEEAHDQGRIYDMFTKPNIERTRFFDEKMSDTLKNDPEAELDHYEESEVYIKSWSRGYKKQVEGLAAQFGEMKKSNRMSICIPVAGHQEHGQIYESLKNYSYQTADNKKFEINLFVNHPKHGKDGKFLPKDASQKTLDEIARFQKDFPDVRVNVMQAVLDPAQANIGTIRKLQTDATLLRHHKRGEGADDLIFASNDADNKGVAPEYVAELLRQFEEHPEKDAILGNLDWDPEAYIRYPEVYVGTRLFQYLNAVGRKRSGGMVTSGANSSYRASIYAGIGGYIPEVGGEDVAIGQAIVHARGTRDSIGYSKKAKLFTSARRSVEMMQKYGLAPVEQWDTGFTPFDELREGALDRSIDLDIDDPAVRENITRQIQHVINRTVTLYNEGEKLRKDGAFFRESINALGVRYRVNEDNNIEITDMSRFFNHLRQYKREAVAHRDMQSGKPGARKEFLSERKKWHEDEAERQEKITEKFDEEASSFVEDAIGHLSFDMAEHDFDEENCDADIIDGYIVDTKNPIKNDEEGRAVYYAKSKTDSTTKIVKVVDDKNSLDRWNELPEGVSSVEEYLSDQEFPKDTTVLMPEKMENNRQGFVRVYEAGSTDLNSILKSGHSFTPKEAIGVVVGVCMALKDLHAYDIAHTDVTPNNVIFDKEGNVRLIDLENGSIKKHRFFERKSVHGGRFIQPAELLQEKRRGVVRFDSTVDIYETGVSMFRLITGKYPYYVPDIEGGNMPSPDSPEYHEKEAERLTAYAGMHKSGNIEFPDSVPPALQTILKKAMSPYSEGRYQSVEEFGLALMEAYKHSLI